MSNKQPRTEFPILPSMRIEVITDIHRFAALMDEWDELLEKTPRNSIFLSHEWLYSWWEIYGGVNSLYIIVCRNSVDDRLTGLFPAYLKKRWKLIHSLKFLGSEHVCSDFLDIIVLPQVKSEVYSAIFQFISDNSKVWDIIELTDLAEDSPLVDLLCGNKPIHLDLYQPATDRVCPYLELPSDWNQFLQTKSAHSRKKILYNRRNLEKQFHVQLTEISTEKQLEDIFKDMVRLHQGRRAFKGDDGAFTSGEFSRFILAVCKRMLHKGWLQLVFLELNGTKVSFYLNMKHGDRVFYYQSGFDMAWSKFSVSYVLLSHLIEKAICDQCKTYEFLRGDEKYKYGWTTSSIRLTDIIIYNSNFRGKSVKYMKIIKNCWRSVKTISTKICCNYPAKKNAAI